MIAHRHLLAFIKMYQPGTMFRLAVIGGQCVFATFFGTMYVINPTYCHRLVGYVEEEACSTYTKIIGGIEAAPEGSELAAWRTQIAPAIGRAYWHLGEEGTVLDLMLAIRADEANHRDVNHLAAGMKPGQINPFFDPEVPRPRPRGAFNLRAESRRRNPWGFSDAIDATRHAGQARQDAPQVRARHPRQDARGGQAPHDGAERRLSRSLATLWPRTHSLPPPHARVKKRLVNAGALQAAS